MRTQEGGNARPGPAMPTLVTCAVAGLVLVVAVGLQAPAHSVGLRWKLPRYAGRHLAAIEIDAPSPRELPGFADPDLGWLARLGWMLAALVAFWILVRLVRWVLRIARPPSAITVAGTGADSRVSGEPDAKKLRSGLAAALQVLTSERDPGNGVVLAWQGLQDAAAAAGIDRRPAETTSEFTARILYRSRNSAEPIDVLLSLYQRVRFGDHAPDAGEIAAARDSLAALVELWRTDLPERRQRRAAR
jgi:hypothetical protein